MTTNYKYALPVAFDGFTTQINVDVSFYVEDATQALWELYDLTGAPIVGACAPIDAETVQLTVNPALPAGNYELVGIQ